MRYEGIFSVFKSTKVCVCVSSRPWYRVTHKRQPRIICLNRIRKYRHVRGRFHFRLYYFHFFFFPSAEPRSKRSTTRIDLSWWTDGHWHTRKSIITVPKKSVVVISRFLGIQAVDSCVEPIDTGCFRETFVRE